MKKRPAIKYRRVNFLLDPDLDKALTAHRSAMKQARGMPVTLSEAIRDAIFRTRQLSLPGLGLTTAPDSGH